MTSNHGLPLVAPRITPVLEPGFRPAVLANRAFRALVRATPGAVPVRLALEQADGSVFRFDTAVLPDTHPQAAGNAVYLERYRQVPALVARRLADPLRRPGDPLAARWRRTIATRRRAGSTTTSSASGCSTTRSRSCRRRTCPPSARDDHAARPASRRLPHRLRPRRQRSQGGGGDRRQGGLQRGDGLGSVPPAGSAVSLRRHHGLAAARRPRTCRGSTPSAAARPAST